MSIDWNVLCDECKKWHHLGQFMGGLNTFGYGSKDERGRNSAGEFINNHLSHCREEGFLRIVCADNTPIDYQKESIEV